MGLKCSVCSHQQRTEIDKLLVAPDPNFSAIARMFPPLKRDAIRRHVENNHAAAKLKKAARAQEALEADELLQEFEDIQAHQKTIFEEARARELKIKLAEGGEVVQAVVPDNKLALEALRDMSKTLEFRGKLTGKFKDPKQSGGSGNTPGGTAISQTFIYVPDNNRGQKTDETGG